MAQIEITNKTFKLNSGYEMPAIGLGTKTGDREKTIKIIKNAIESGYRHIDTAALYGTEEMVREAIKHSSVKREEIFVTTKLWVTDLIKERVRPAFEKSFNILDLGYIDLYLIHWPFAFKYPQTDPPVLIEDYDFMDTWRELEKLVDEGKVRSIGVSNFNVPKLQRLVNEARIKPSVNQVELHPYLSQPELKKFCDDNHILLTGFSPLGRSIEPRIDLDPVIVNIANKYSIKPAQVLLSWAVQRGTSVVPRSSNPERQVLNLKLVELDQQSLDAIEGLNRNHRYIDSERDWNVKNVF